MLAKFYQPTLSVRHQLGIVVSCFVCRVYSLWYSPKLINFCEKTPSNNVKPLIFLKSPSSKHSLIHLPSFPHPSIRSHMSPAFFFLYFITTAIINYKIAKDSNNCKKVIELENWRTPTRNQKDSTRCQREQRAPRKYQRTCGLRKRIREGNENPETIRAFVISFY